MESFSNAGCIEFTLKKIITAHFSGPGLKNVNKTPTAAIQINSN
jgi:hypothetical protein